MNGLGELARKAMQKKRDQDIEFLFATSRGYPYSKYPRQITWLQREWARLHRFFGVE